MAYIIQALPGAEGPTFWPVQINENNNCSCVDALVPMRITGHPFPLRTELGDLLIWSGYTDPRLPVCPATAYTRDGRPLYGPLCVAHRNPLTGGITSWQTLDAAKQAIARLHSFLTEMPDYLPRRAVS